MAQSPPTAPPIVRSVLNVTELAPGLAYWMAPHPEWEPDENWPEDVLCVYFEASDGTV